MNFDLDTIKTFAEGAAYIIAGASVALRVIAPLTKTKKDDEFASTMAGWATWILEKLSLAAPPALNKDDKEGKA